MVPTNFSFKSLPLFVLSFALLSCIVDDIVVPDSERVVPVDYMPFAEEGKVWVYGVTRSDDKNILEKYRYQIVGDTLIGNRHYKKMYAREADKYNDTLMHYIGAVRDSLMKVLFVDAGQHKERLLYDFGLQPENMMRWYGYTLIASYYQKEKEVEGKIRHTIAIHTSNYEIDDIWIEGIGCAKGMYASYDPITKRRGILIRCDDTEGCCYDYRKNYQIIE